MATYIDKEDNITKILLAYQKWNNQEKIDLFIMLLKTIYWNKIVDEVCKK